MGKKKEKLARKIYLYLAGLFITALVVSNLIFQKFFYWYPFDIEIFDNKLFELSVGILPYPITFLITDIISEIYGKKKAIQVVITGIFASFFSIILLLVADSLPAIENSPIKDTVFKEVFSMTPLAVIASMLAYLCAQLVDIKIFHFWKNLTKGKLLWLRNNFSTFSSQFIDSSLVIGLLCSFNIISWDLFWGLVLSAVIFKILIAIIDTPILYFFVWLLRKKFNLKINEEIKY
jgi:hypothetical protein